jgi:hypothetical protein
MKVAIRDCRKTILKNRLTKFSHRATRILSVFLLGVLVLSSVGCFRLRENVRRAGYPEKLFEEYRDYVWAQRAFNLRYGNCNIANGEDFGNGFVEGYCDVCNGGTGHAPAVPPNEYWGDRYQTEAGSNMVSAWFRGYPEGVRAARQDGATRFNKIYMSNEMLAALEMKKDSSSTVTAEEFRKATQNRNLPNSKQRNSNNPVPISSPDYRNAPMNWNPANN